MTDIDDQESWEAYATSLANASSDQKLLEAYAKIIAECHIKLEEKAKVIFARDTRPSGAHLTSILAEALEATETEYNDYSLLTTPQLHYITRCLNTKGTPYEYGEPNEQGYYAKIAASFKAALQGRQFSDSVTVDCANGIGGPKLRELTKNLPSPFDGGLGITIVNDDVINPDRLNFQVRSIIETAIFNSAETVGSIVWSGFRQNKPTSTTIHPCSPPDEVRIP